MNLNRVVLTGNLTRDPELRKTSNELSVLSLRIASNSRQKTKDGTWEEKPNYFDVTIFGGQADNCAKHLHKGRGVGVDGRLDWSEWEIDGGEKRQTVRIIADQVQFLGSGRSAEEQVETANGGSREESPF